MDITFLGTGTSQGVPVIGCKCLVCNSGDSRDVRLRTSAMITTPAGNIIIDVGPDFRAQMLNNNVDDIEAILITHEHNDHVIGLDDIRPFYFRKGDGISYHTTLQVEKEIRTRFPYVFNTNPYPGAPKVIIQNFEHGKKFPVEDVTVMPILVSHGRMDVTAFRIDDFLYITDASFISEESLKLMEGSKVMVINALRHEKHHSHFTLQEALEVVKLIGPDRAYLTHISHSLGAHKELQEQLPANVFLSHDNLKITV